MEYAKELFEALTSIIVAVIAGWALLRASRIEYTEKRQRAHWFFEDYLFSVGKCIGDYNANKAEYYANYTRYLLYANKKVLAQMNKINSIIEDEDKDKIIEQVRLLKKIYKDTYKIDQYLLKRKKNK